MHVYPEIVKCVIVSDLVTDLSCILSIYLQAHIFSKNNKHSFILCQNAIFKLKLFLKSSTKCGKILVPVFTPLFI